MKSPLSFQQLLRPDLKAHIYANSLRSNVANLQSLCNERTRFCAVVKANAYGHGMADIVSVLRNCDVQFFAVASVYEAAYINPLVSGQEILIFEPINRHMSQRQLQLCANENFHCAISSIDAAEYAAEVLSGTSLNLNLHINIETGMGRLGIEPDEAEKLIALIDASPNLSLKGIYTHFATADED